MCVYLTDEHDVSPSTVAYYHEYERESVCVFLTDEHDVSPSTVASVLS